MISISKSYTDIINEIAEVVPLLVADGVFHVDLTLDGDDAILSSTFRNGAEVSVRKNREGSFTDEEWEKFGAPVLTFVNFLLFTASEVTDAPIST